MLNLIGRRLKLFNFIQEQKLPYEFEVCNLADKFGYKVDHYNDSTGLRSAIRAFQSEDLLEYNLSNKHISITAVSGRCFEEREEEPKMYDRFSIRVDIETGQRIRKIYDKTGIPFTRILGVFIERNIDRLESFYDKGFWAKVKDRFRR